MDETRECTVFLTRTLDKKIEAFIQLTRNVDPREESAWDDGAESFVVSTKLKLQGQRRIGR